MVDHIVPVEISPERRLDFSNLQPLCVDCHAVKTAFDLAYYRNVTDRPDSRLLWPNWLKPSRIPLTVVCGPPASGKSTWVASNAACDDIIIDIDIIHRRLTGKTGRERTQTELAFALAERNLLLANLNYERKGKAFFIVGAPNAYERDRWSRTLCPQAVIVLATPIDECMRRIAVDPDRERISAWLGPAVTRWWNRYTPRTEDIVISPSQGVVNV